MFSYEDAFGKEGKFQDLDDCSILPESSLCVFRHIRLQSDYMAVFLDWKIIKINVVILLF